MQIKRKMPKEMPNSAFFILKKRLAKTKNKRRKTDLIATINPNFADAYTISLLEIFLRNINEIINKSKLTEKDINIEEKLIDEIFISFIKSSHYFDEIINSNNNSCNKKNKSPFTSTIV